MNTNPNGSSQAGSQAGRNAQMNEAALRGAGDSEREHSGNGKGQTAMTQQGQAGRQDLQAGAKQGQQPTPVLPAAMQLFFCKFPDSGFGLL